MRLPMHTSSLHSENAASTMQMIQQLNLESPSDVSHRASHRLLQDHALITSSPESSDQSDTHLQESDYASEAHRPNLAVHATKMPEGTMSSLDMDLSVEDMMEHDARDSSLLCCSSSYQSDREIPSEDLLCAGDRVGPGLYHDGELIRIAPTCDGSDALELFDKPLEVVKLLGQGSYAIVYLVREVHLSETAAFVDTDFDASTTPCAPTQSHPFSPSKTPVQHNPAWHRNEYTSTTEEAPYYALKCLSKRNLTPEQAFLQQHELTIHQSIPAHPNIVTMHGAYETTDWLFLVLEYCPGKDLYFWLEEANDASSMLSSITRLAPSQVSTDSPNGLLEPDTSSPWLLSSTSPEALLSERRLELVSAVFQQMCHAVQFCHDLGISHRDIKPENFIVEDRRGCSGQPGADVIVKLTDFGLATSAELSRDFNCGSKPYMAFECRHDLTSYYDPKQSDTWSLGVVLLNLIFHRSPFKDASAKHCASFAAFSYKPILFLMQAFDGMTEEMAHFLNDNVFCDVSDGQRRRITPLAFGHWAKGLSHVLQRQTGPFAHSSPFPIVSSGNHPQAEGDEQHPADSPLSDTLAASSHGLRNYTSLTNHATVHGGVSSFPEPSLDSLPDGAMSASLSLSRSSAPFHSAVP
ncbi:hypothetical protein MNAN1_001970 [Malassezia nana]|uniref:Protein kinase domain-containing protein n=1 Tax=Malassezia nana TaxID=180528 RepID=A0AAF0ELE4_9BASI|nr:hypothetical protein MNAN1_001970 [Malassezia nana]